MFWQKNPLTVIGNLDRCWLFTYRTPAELARSLLPRPLEPVTHASYAFWNIVVCHISAMRPRHFPAFIGIDYWHLAYRLYVCLPLAQGRAIEGLYFLRSECDHRLMELSGNLLTDFRFHAAQLRIQQDQEALEIRLESPDAPAYARLLPDIAPQHDPRSAFASLDEAAAFLKYKPYGISLDQAGRVNVVHITRDESAWRSRLVRVAAADWAFFRGQSVEPEICYEVEPILYQWDRGRIYDLQRASGQSDQVTMIQPMRLSHTNLPSNRQHLTSKGRRKPMGGASTAPTRPRGADHRSQLEIVYRFANSYQA